MSAELGKTGQFIWDAYGAGKLDASSQALVRELARCADTLDRLDGLAAGRKGEWAFLVFDDMGEIHLSIDKVLDEQRKTQMVFKGLFGELRQAGIKVQAGGEVPQVAGPPQDMLAILRKQKEDRERKSG